MPSQFGICRPTASLVLRIYLPHCGRTPVVAAISGVPHRGRSRVGYLEAAGALLAPDIFRLARQGQHNVVASCASRLAWIPVMNVYGLAKICDHVACSESGEVPAFSYSVVFSSFLPWPKQRTQHPSSPPMTMRVRKSLCPTTRLRWYLALCVRRG